MSKRLQEPLDEIARLNQLSESGFSDVDAIREVLAIREAQLSTDVDRLIGVLRYYAGRRHSLEELRERVKAEIEAVDRRVESIEGYVRATISMYPNYRLRGDLGEFVVQNAGGVKPLKVDLDLKTKSVGKIVDSSMEIHPKYLQQVSYVTLNTDLVREDLEKGEKLDFAALGERKQTLKVKL